MTQTPVSTHDSEQDPRNENILIYVDGSLVPKREAVVSVYDSGFMLGDGIRRACGSHVRRLRSAYQALIARHVSGQTAPP